MKITNENSLLHYLKSGINFFVGAGFSVEAKNKKEKLPTGGKLLDKIIDNFGLQHCNSLELSKISTILELTRKDDFFNFLKEEFDVNKYDPLYDGLLSVNIKSVITTNIDNLWFKIIENSHNHYINDITISGPLYNDRSGIDYIPLHGCILHNPLDFVFSDLKISSSFSTDVDRWHYLVEKIKRIPTIFWGYSLDDAGVFQALQSLISSNRDHKEKWIILKDYDEASVMFFEALNFKIIISDTREFLEYINNKIQSIQDECIAKISIKKLFPEYSIPDISAIPAKSIDAFYAGSQPDWYYIFFGELHKINYYYTIKDSIFSGKNIVVIGIPACGKTTLMMQIASDIEFYGHKLICNSLSTEKAKLLTKKLGEEKALIFIDNFSDDADALSVLYEKKTIQFVAFDRIYQYDQVSHKIDKKSTNIIEISDISNRDIQNIFEKIPTALRRDKLFLPKTTEYVPLSVFEIVEGNIPYSNTSNYRARKIIDDLKKSSYELYQLLLMCCYVHKCRTPVSYDMIYAFIRNEIEDYSDVYVKINSLRSLLIELSSQIIGLEDQDYYLPRSTYFSETMIALSNPLDIKKMLINFYSKISVYRICNLFTFKKHAFDADLMSKIFINWEEGVSFYKYIEEIDISPYLKQQCALYLSHKKKYKEAFSWIDKALMQSDYRKPSIRNSHAVILFRANIEYIHDTSSISSLRKSMEILQECYFSDKRKVYHALTYSEFALKYSNFLNDEFSKNYILNAKKWLSEELEKVPESSNCKRLLSLINKKGY